MLFFHPAVFKGRKLNLCSLSHFSLFLMDEICLHRHSIDCTPSVYMFTAFNFRNTAETNSFTMPHKNGKTFLLKLSYVPSHMQT
jgi:hypothetical protein